ncbi:MAG TPA: biosynthetic-type acetolactate synthase large subunit, partial [Deinococcales bacterium]|nr:biosynthetic-type acetolactate synthase large subunit [Deinococcales bacterium]
GNVATGLIGTDAFQEADITGITIPVTKHNFLVRNVADLPRTIARAIHIARSGRPGPVLVDVPKDVQLAACPTGGVDPLPVAPPTQPDERDVAAAAQAIAGAARPLLMVGGGAQNASREVAAFARHLNLPVTTTLMGLGAFPASDPRWLGMPGMHGTVAANRAITNCDLIIAVGCRFDDRVTGKVSRFARNARVVHIDLDAAEHGKLVTAHIPMRADAGLAMRALVDALPAGGERRDWWSHLDGWKRERKDVSSWSAGRAVRDISRRLNAEDIVVTDVGQHQMLAAQEHPVELPRTFLTSGGLGTMGFGLPAAIGAQMARPDARVVAIVGDGGFQMTLQEMATARKYDVPVKVAIINNGYLGMVRQWQELFNDERYSEVYLEDANPDFELLARAYRWEAARVDAPEDMDAAVDRWLASDGPALLDVRVPHGHNVFPMVPAGAALEDMIVDKPEEVGA